MGIQKGSEVFSGIKFAVGGLLELANAKVVLNKFSAKTAAYTITENDSGTIFTNRGSGAFVKFTLPINPRQGLVYLFISVEDQQITIALDDSLEAEHEAGGSTRAYMITFNKTNTKTVYYSTVGEKIGACGIAIADGSNWIFVNLSPNTMSTAGW